MQDNDFATWNAYRNRYWPAKYLIDATGIIRYTHFGEGNYDETEKKIQELIAIDIPIDNPAYQVQSKTPETYLGALRGDYSRITTTGIFTKTEEYAMPQKGATLSYVFNAKNVFVVMRGNGNVRVFLDGNFVKDIAVKEDKLYTLIELDQPGEHTLELRFLDSNIELYAFTFG